MKEAIISYNGSYRYTLKRKITVPLRWVRPCVFIMLNPSTADHIKDDPTIRKCIGFAQLWGCTSLTVINLFAYRATKPKELLRAEDPIGPKNNDYIREVLNDSKLGVVVAAWGAHKASMMPEVSPIKDIIKDIWPVNGLKCLGFNKDGSPKHPLYMPYSSKLTDYQL